MDRRIRLMLGPLPQAARTETAASVITPEAVNAAFMVMGRRSRYAATGDCGSRPAGAARSDPRGTYPAPPEECLAPGMVLTRSLTAA